MHRIPLLPVAAHLLLLEAAWIAATHHHVGLVVRIRHIVVLLLADGLATVRSDRSARCAVDNTGRIATI